MTAFHTWWLVSLVALVILAMWIGRTAGKGTLGILIDQRGRYSLTHFQVVLWTLTIMSSSIGVLISKGFDPTQFEIPAQLLGLMGISAGSAVLATGVKGAKDLRVPPKVAWARVFTHSDGEKEDIRPHFSQIWLEEEGEQVDKVVSITKYQNFIFTLVILGFYVTIASKTGGLPVLPDNVVWLIGISHAGYVGAKVPDKK